MTAATLERPSSSTRSKKTRPLSSTRTSPQQLYVAEWATHIKGVPFQVLSELAYATHVCGRGACPRRRCDKEGLVWLTVGELAARTHRSPRAVQYALRQLEAAGELVAEYGGTCRAWGYRMLMPAMNVSPDTGELLEAPAEPVETAANGADQTVEKCAPGAQGVRPGGATSAPNLRGISEVSDSGGGCEPAPGDVEEGHDRPPSAGPPSGCPTHPQGELRCRSCRAVRRVNQAAARAAAGQKIKGAAREARAEVERGGYGPQGTKDGPQRLAGSFDHALMRIPDPPTGAGP